MEEKYKSVIYFLVGIICITLAMAWNNPEIGICGIVLVAIEAIKFLGFIIRKLIKKLRS